MTLLNLHHDSNLMLFIQKKSNKKKRAYYDKKRQKCCKNAAVDWFYISQAFPLHSLLQINYKNVQLWPQNVVYALERMVIWKYIHKLYT